MTNQEHINHILKLNKRERVSIAQLLWDSIASDNESVAVSQEEKDLLNERKRQYDDGQFEGDSWENVRERLFKQ